MKLPSSRITLPEPQSAAQTRNVQITCRGEDSLSVSNTQPGEERPEKAGGFRGKIDIEFQDILKSYHLFLFRLKVYSRHKNKLLAYKASARLKHSSDEKSWGDETFMKDGNSKNNENLDF